MMHPGTLGVPMERAATKRPGRYSIPRLRRSALHRDRLTTRLLANLGNGLAVVLAPAGYGKTALLVDFATQIEPDYTVAWLALDGSCSAPESFASQLADTLLGEQSWSPPCATKIEDLKSYLDAVCRQFAMAADRPLILVVDNTHELRDADDSGELLAWLLELLPAGTEVVLSGREPARLIDVDRRVAAGECLVLDAATLAFTEDEIAALSAGFDAPALPHEIVSATGGWPIAVMAVLAGTVSIDGATRTCGTDAWERYLLKEVWRSVPERYQRSLLALSIPAVIDTELAVSLVGKGAWHAIAPWLAASTLLGEPLGDGFQLNPQIQRYLRTEFESQAPERFATVVGRTAQHLEGRGQIADAIELARAAGSAEILAGIIVRHSRVLLPVGAFGVLWRGYQALPPTAIEGRTDLLAVGSRILAHHGKANEALAAAETVLADPTAHTTATFHALLGKARALRLLGRITDLVGLFDSIRTAVDCDDPTVRAELAWQEAQTVLATTSEFARAERLLIEAAALSHEAGATSVGLLVRSTLGQLYAMRGDGPDAINELTRAARGWRDQRGSGNLGWVLNNLAMSHLLVGDFESAISVSEEARRESRACENIRNEAYAIASLGDAHLALGQHTEARAFYEEAIRLCATDVLDESLAALSIAGLAAALLGLGELKDADYFGRRALLVAESFGNPLEIGFCKLQQAMVEDATGNHAAAIAFSREAIALFQPIGAHAPLRTAWYRLASCLFRAGRRAEAQEALSELGQLVTEPWMAGPLLPLVREQPLFAQWAASRALSTPWFRELLERHAFAPPRDAASTETPSQQAKIVALSLGQVHVTVGNREVTDETWASARAREMFFLFLANRAGLRKEEAAVALYPDISPDSCNSAFHSNLYRLRRALSQDSVIKRDGSYLLNPEVEFEWDVDKFLSGLDAARRLPAGSPERARLTEDALQHYKGPFAEVFYSEWADTLRRRLERNNQEALSMLAGYYVARGDFESAATCLERVLEHDPHNEQVAFDLVTCRLRSVGPAAALAFIDDYHQSVRNELGEDLPPRFQELRQRIAAGAV